jgi:hypothetical protein
MISPWDVYSAANLLTKQHGPEAAAFAALSSDHLALKGDRAGAAVWLRVSRAVKALERRRLRSAKWCSDRSVVFSRTEGKPHGLNS